MYIECKLWHQKQKKGKCVNVELLYTLKLSCYQLKIGYYKYKMFYVNLTVTTKQNPTINIQI